MPAFCRSPATPVTLVGERPSSALEIPGSAPGRAPRAHAFACSHLQVRACARRCRRPSAGLGKELINLISSPRKTGNSSAIANPLECNDRRIAGNLDDDVIERDLDIERLAAPKLPFCRLCRFRSALQLARDDSGYAGNRPSRSAGASRPRHQRHLDRREQGEGVAFSKKIVAVRHRCAPCLAGGSATGLSHRCLRTKPSR
jgi:hypothetical protein